MPAFGVYIHFPYCAQRCPYCDFAIAVRRTIRHDRYLAAIRAELAHKAPLYAGRQAMSVYFGGGTPSLWRPDCLASALHAALAQFPPPAGHTPEVTVECDPAELSARTAGEAARHHLSALRAAGVNRLSLGAQSFSPAHLAALGRRHQPEDIVAAVAAARAAGFSNLSLDLMIGLPEQSLAELNADLDALLALSPEHVSLYLLTVEPRTPLAAAIARGAAPGVDPERQAQAYEHVRARLGDAGFHHYEISNFARRVPGHDYASVHNRLYWTGGEYVGLGVGAHSFRRQSALPGEHPAGTGERFANLRGIDPYLAVWDARGVDPATAPRRATLPLAPADAPMVASLPHAQIDDPPLPGLALFEDRDGDSLAREAMWLSLRRIDGISAAAFQAEYGIDPHQAFAEEIADGRRRGLLATDEPIRLSPAGLLYADEVGASFL